MAYVFRCEACGHNTYVQKGFNSNRTKKKLKCKECGKINFVDLALFEGSVTASSISDVKSVVEPKVVNVTNDSVLTVDLENERKENREPSVAKTRVININGQQGAFPNFTEAMVENYAKSMNHTLRYDEKEGIYYLTAKTGSKA